MSDDLTLPISVTLDATGDATLSMPAGSTYPSLAATLTDADGEPVALGDAAVVELHLRQGNDVVLEAGATIEDADAGRVTYRWRDRDTADRGDYRGRFVIRWADGRVLQAPTERPLQISFTKP